MIGHPTYGPLYAGPLELPDGRIAYVGPLTFGRAQLAIGTDVFADDRYTYDDPATAIAALETWNGEGDPAGWIRHQPSNRRRPGGDPALEHVAP